MSRAAPDLWLVGALARQSLESGTLRAYWPGLRAHGGSPRRLTRAAAWVVWLGLVPLIPLVAARRRRLTARALEAVVRAIVAGVETRTALDRGVAWLSRKGVPTDLARADLERLLAGFLSAPSGAASEAKRRARGSGVNSAW